MERFLWQSYPQHLQNTLFHAERIAPLRKKSLQERLEQAYDFMALGDKKLNDGKYKEAQLQYEFAYGMFKYCEKVGRKITMKDDTKSARELREERQGSNEDVDDAFDKFWREVDAMVCSCLTLMAVCKMNYRNPLLEEALAAANEALEFNPDHAPALFRRSQVHEQLEMFSESVADARQAYKHAPDEMKFELWRHMKHAVETRRANSFFWGFLGALGDAPGALLRLPWTLGAMPAHRRNFIIFLVSLAVGIYRLPPGTLAPIRHAIAGSPPPAAVVEAANLTEVVNITMVNDTVASSIGAAAEAQADGVGQSSRKGKQERSKKKKKGKGFVKGMLKALGLGKGQDQKDEAPTPASTFAAEGSPGAVQVSEA